MASAYLQKWATPPTSALQASFRPAMSASARHGSEADSSKSAVSYRATVGASSTGPRCCAIAAVVATVDCASAALLPASASDDDDDRRRRSDARSSVSLNGYREHANATLRAREPVAGNV